MRAVELLDESTPVRIRIDHEMLLAIAQGRIPSLADSARERFESIERLTVRLERADLLLATVNNRAYAEYQGGSMEYALVAANRLRTLLAQSGSEPYLPYLDTIASVQVAVGEFAEAICTLSPVRDQQVRTDTPEPDALAECMLTLAEAQRRNGDLEAAQGTLQDCRQVAVERGLDGILVRARGEQAELSAAHGHYKAAYEQLRQYMEEVRAQSSAEVDSRAGVLQAVFETERGAAGDPALPGAGPPRPADRPVQPPARRRAPARPAASAADAGRRSRGVRRPRPLQADQRPLLARDRRPGAARVAELLHRTCVGSAGFVARMGGEEFLLVFPGTSTSGALIYCEAVQSALRNADSTPLTGAVKVPSEHGTGLDQRAPRGEPGRAARARPTAGSTRPSQPGGAASSGDAARQRSCG